MNDLLKTYLWPYLKAYVAFFAGWLVSHQSQASGWLVETIQQSFGLAVPEAVVSAFIALVVAFFVWLVPNRK